MSFRNMSQYFTVTTCKAKRTRPIVKSLNSNPTRVANAMRHFFLLLVLVTRTPRTHHLTLLTGELTEKNCRVYTGIQEILATVKKENYLLCN